MKQNLYARKERQLKNLSKKLRRFQQDPLYSLDEKPQKLIRKIKKLVRELQSVFSGVYLRRILGPVAVLAGLTFSGPVSAQSFKKPVANPFGLQPADTLAFPAFTDLDGDGDMDLMVSETYGYVKYFQNKGTAENPQFAAPVQNPFGLDTLLKDTTIVAVFPAFADLDGDGDQDLLFGRYNGSFEYFQNVGTAKSPKFAAPVTNPFGLDPVQNIAAPVFVDLDGDGDMDLLVGEYYGGLEYFENTGTATQPKFAAPVKNPFGLRSTYYFAFPAFADIDNDGDQDLLVGEYYGNTQFFENTGTATQPQFAAPVKNPFGIDSLSYLAVPAFADLDNDGDQDLLMGESGYDTGDYLANLEYFENTLITGIKPFFNDERLSLYPSPVKDKLTVQSPEKIEKIEVFDLLGKNIATFGGETNSISLARLKTGIYEVKITFGKGDFVVRKIVKQ